MRWARPRSFRRSLAVNLLVTVLLFALVTAGATYAAMRLAAQRASEAMMTQVVDTVAAETSTFYRSVSSIFTLVEFWAARTWSGAWDTYEFDRIFAPMLLAFYEASSVYLAQGSGDFYMLSRDDATWLSWTVRPVAWGDRALVRTWSDDNPLPREVWRRLEFDVRMLPWFEAALERIQAVGGSAPLAERTAVAGAALSPTTGIPGQALTLTGATPLGEHFVFAFERSLTGVTERLAELRVLEGGVVATLSGEPGGSGELILTGVPVSGEAHDLAAAKHLILAPPDRLGGPVAALVAGAAASHGTLPRTPVRFTSDGVAWWGMARRVEAGGFDQAARSDWVVAVVPEEDLLRRLPRLGTALAAVTALALALAFLRARALASRFSQPIDELVDHSRRMQRLDFERPARVDTDIVEIGILGGTLESMRRALHAYASISEETRIAEAILRGTLPASLRRPDGYAIEAVWQPATETGGEIFDVLVEESGAAAERVALLLLEPDSFGVEAAVLSAQLRAVFRSAVRAGATPAEIAARLQRCLQEDVREAGTVRAWIGLLDPPTGRLDWVAAGLARNLVHLHVGGSGADLLESTDPPLGAVGAHGCRTCSQMLAQGDLVAVVSDGVIDALSGARERFGIERVRDTLLRHAAAEPAALTGEIERAIAAFTGGGRVLADRTVLLLKRS